MKLYEYRGKTWVFINAEINEKGSLVLSGQDVGEVPEKHFGDSDYEYWVVVLEQHKDRVILVLMEKAFGGNSKAVSEFMDLMKSKGIPYEFDSWV